MFKERFQEEYLLYLRNRHVADHHADPVEVPKIGKGDLVLVAKENVKRSLWDLAIVTELLPSREDGRVRSVRLRIGRNETTRPIVKLYPLMRAEELRPEVDEVQDHGQNQGNETLSQDNGEPEVQTVEPERHPSVEDNHQGTQEEPSDAEPDISNQPTPAALGRPSRAAKMASENIEQENHITGESDVVPDPKPQRIRAVPTSPNQRPSRASKTAAKDFIHGISQDLLEDLLDDE